MSWQQNALTSTFFGELKEEIIVKCICLNRKSIKKLLNLLVCFLEFANDFPQPIITNGNAITGHGSTTCDGQKLELEIVK